MASVRAARFKGGPSTSTKKGPQTQVAAKTNADQEILNKLAYCFMLVAVEMLEKNGRVDCKKALAWARKRYPAGWSPTD